jgi:glycosyltransferase involved in cell wall biosynthesis
MLEIFSSAANEGSIREEYCMNDGKENMLVTFAIFAYNQEKFIREAVEGAFAQTYAPLEIILSDDCSNDATFEIMRELAEAYRGPHTVKLNKNNVNLGLVGHVNKMFEMAQGDLIVVSAGDDISIPSRTQELVKSYVAAGLKPMLLHSSVINIDTDGNELGVRMPSCITESMDLERMATAITLYIGASGAWSKRLYQDFGPIEFKNAYEDLVLGFRAALKEAVLFVEEPLVKYRVNVGISGKAVEKNAGIAREIKDRLKVNSVYIDVLKQRAKDLERLPDGGGEKISSVIEQSLSLRLAGQGLYQSPMKSLLSLFGSNRAVMREAILEEVKLLAWLARKRFARLYGSR